jgi:glycosyltransferase involved in cell wall biosynthesis
MSGDAAHNGRSALVAPLRIAYLCALYPAVSHTFVLREVRALRRLGMEIATFSIRRAGADQLLSREDREAFAETVAILPPNWRRLLRAHLTLVRESPIAYIRVLALALSLAPAGLRGRLWQLFYFVESVLLWRECRAREIRHIHVHLANVAADVALLCTSIGTALEPDRRWSWSFTMHGPTEFFDVAQHRLPEKLLRARFVVGISDYTRSQLMAFSPPEIWERLHVIHVGIPIEQFTRTEDEHATHAEPTILFIGRQVPEKGEGVLLHAAAQLIERGYGFKLVLAGEGPARAGFERLASRLGIGSHVSFPGAVGQEEIHAMYAEASIFCLPSFAEGVPGVLMEAMAMELPVLSTRITGIPELVEDEHTGLLVSPGRVNELTTALARLLDDPSLRHRLGVSARERVVEDFNTESSARRLHELFERELQPDRRNLRKLVAVR